MKLCESTDLVSNPGFALLLLGVLWQERNSSVSYVYKDRNGSVNPAPVEKLSVLVLPMKKKKMQLITQIF